MCFCKFSATKWVVGVCVLVSSCVLAQEDLTAESESVVFEKLLDLSIRENKLSKKDLRDLVADDDEDEEVEVEYDGFSYVLEFRNKGTVELAGLDVQYRFYYELDQHWRRVQQVGVNQTSEDKTEIKFQDGSFSISSALPVKRLKEEAGPFVVKSWRLSGDHYFSGDTPEEADAKRLGLWVRVSYKTPDGMTLTRDFSDPSTLAENGKVIW